MIVGILSDTHGRADAAAAAVVLLLGRGAEFLIHCGDVGGEAVLDAIAAAPAAFVFGNNDWDHAGLSRHAESIGITCLGDGGVLDLGGRRVAVTHGDDTKLMTRLAADADYLLTGHSHQRHDRPAGPARWINPGALYRATVKTAAVLDLSTGALVFVEVPGV